MGVNVDLALALIPKFGSTLSMFSSSFIIAECISDHRKGKGTPIQRTLVGMSAVDIVASFAWFLSTWPLPKGTAPLAVGNITSCNFQGFLLQLAIGSPLYNCSLALYYLLVIKFNWANDQLVKIERYVHGFIIIFSVGTSIVGLPLTMYNEIRTVCWVIGSPSECGNSSSSPSDIPCDRGDWAWLFGIILFYGPLWVCVLLTIIAMVMIYVQVRRTLKRNEQYRFQAGRRTSGLFYNRTGRPPTNLESESALSGTGGHRTVDAAGQMSARMSRFSAFSLTKKSMEELKAVSEIQDDAEGMEQHEESTPADDEDEDEDGECDTENHDEDPSELEAMPAWRRPYSRSYVSTESYAERSGNNEGSLRSGWMVSTTTDSEVLAASTRSSARARIRRASKMQYRAQKKQNMFAIQAILYSTSFFITWTPSTVWSVAYWLGAGGVGFDLASACCEPLQGFWNLLIFIRSRPSSQAKLQRIFGSFFCFCVNLLPNMNESSNESSKNMDRSSTDRRRKSSMMRNSQDSVEAIASEQRRSQSEAHIEHEKCVAFETDPSSDES